MIRTREGIICEICRRALATDKHRIFPATKGGRYESGNVIHTCEHCHVRIHRILRDSNSTDFIGAIERAKCWAKNE